MKCSSYRALINSRNKISDDVRNRHLQNYNYLVKIKGYLISKDHLSIVMEFMDGGSLFDVLHKKEMFSGACYKRSLLLLYLKFLS